MWGNPRVRAAVDCGETDQGDLREEIVVGNAYGGKPGSHGSNATLLSNTYGMEPKPFSTQTLALEAEQQRGWLIKGLMH